MKVMVMVALYGVMVKSKVGLCKTKHSAVGIICFYYGLYGGLNNLHVLVLSTGKNLIKQKEKNFGNLYRTDFISDIPLDI